ncbi:MAG: hypothetical protein NTW86_29750 [Candidatus Sumerlaeota bacterium]|nr:hypothetical protein [Candidatus Sumerlaeota bacterium]
MHPLITGLPLWLCVASHGAAADPPRMENENLVVEIQRDDATLTVIDKRCGRVYRQFVPPGDPAFHVDSIKTESNRLVAALKGPIEAVWTLEFGPEAGDLLSTLSADPKTPLDGELAFPHPFEVTPKRDWHLLNMREGIILPVEDPIIFQSLKKESRENEWGNAWGADGSDQMKNWFGTTDLKSGVATINVTTWDARLSLRLLDGPQRFVGSFVWAPSMDTFAYDRKLIYHFSADGNYVPLAKRVRRYCMENTPWITLKQKREKLPQVDQLIGAVDIWLFRDEPWRVADLKGDEAGKRNTRRVGSDASEKRPANPILSPEFVRELKQAGIAKALLCFFQDDYHDSPESHSDADGMIAAGAKAGFLPLVYDNYTVMKPTWSQETIDRLTLRNKDGSVYASPNGKPNVYYPWVIDVARDEVRADLQEHPMKARFYDTLPARPLVEAYMPGLPPSNRETTVKGRVDFARMLVDDLGLVIGGENLAAFMIPYLHYNEGTMTMSGFTGGSESASKGWIDWPIDPILTRYGLNEYYRLPLNELVFHDCIVSTWHWRTENHKNETLWWKHDLFNCLYGTMPLWDLKPGLWKEYKDRFVESYKNVCGEVFNKVGYDEMTDHKWLTPDRKVQESDFSSGLRVIVNFGNEPFPMDGGQVVAPKSFLTIATAKP